LYRIDRGFNRFSPTVAAIRLKILILLPSLWVLSRFHLKGYDCRIQAGVMFVIDMASLRLNLDAARALSWANAIDRRD
jgi:hypothetical protein